MSKKNSLTLKGIAILMMLCHHNFRKTSLFSNYAVSFWPFQQYQVVKLSYMFKICVSIFVFITGYGLTIGYKKINANYKLKREEMVPWLVERFIKTMKGYWFIFLLSSVVCQVIDGRTWNVYFSDGALYGMVEYILSFLGLSRILQLPLLNFTWWYMSAAVIYIFLVPIYNWISKNYLGYVTTIFLTGIIPRMLGITNPDNTQPLPYVLILFIGCACAENDVFTKIDTLSKGNHVKAAKIMLAIVSIILLFCCYKEYAIFIKEGIWELSFAIIPFAVIVICYIYVCPLPIVNTVLEYLGKHSMNIFLIHTFIRGIYLEEFTYSWKHFMLIVFVLLGISLLCSIVIEYIKKKIKYDIFMDKFSNRCINYVRKELNE